MTTSFTPHPAPRRGPRQYGLSLVRFLSGLALLFAIGGPVGGIAYAINHPGQLLSRGAAAVLWVCIGAGAWLLRGLLLSIIDGNPLLPVNVRRIAGIAALVVVAAAAGELLPALAGEMVLDRLGLGAAPRSPRSGRSWACSRSCDVLGCQPGDLFTVAPR